MVKNIRNIKNTEIQKYIKPYNQETRKSKENPGNRRYQESVIRVYHLGTWAPDIPTESASKLGNPYVRNGLAYRL